MRVRCGRRPAATWRGRALAPTSRCASAVLLGCCSSRVRRDGPRRARLDGIAAGRTGRRASPRWIRRRHRRRLTCPGLRPRLARAVRHRDLLWDEIDARARAAARRRSTCWRAPTAGASARSCAERQRRGLYSRWRWHERLLARRRARHRGRLPTVRPRRGTALRAASSSRRPPRCPRRSPWPAQAPARGAGPDERETPERRCDTAKSSGASRAAELLAPLASWSRHRRQAAPHGRIGVQRRPGRQFRRRETAGRCRASTDRPERTALRHRRRLERRAASSAVTRADAARRCRDGCRARARRASLPRLLPQADRPRHAPIDAPPSLVAARSAARRGRRRRRHRRGARQHRAHRGHRAGRRRRRRSADRRRARATDVAGGVPGRRQAGSVREQRARHRRRHGRAARSAQRRADQPQRQRRRSAARVTRQRRCRPIAWCRPTAPKPRRSICSCTRSRPTPAGATKGCRRATAPAASA